MLDAGDGLVQSFDNMGDIFTSWLPTDYAAFLIGAIAILLILAIKRLFIS